MNQILYAQVDKNKGPIEIKTIVRIFAILIIIFGIILLSKGLYAIFTQMQNNKTENTPLVTINQEKNDIKLSIKHINAIDKIVYNWNQKQEYTLQGRGRTEIEEKIEIPKDVTQISIKVIDSKGKVFSYTQPCKRSNNDVTQPEIELLVENSKVKIVARDETAMDYISYYWNNEEETRVDVREDSPNKIEEKVSILKGENTITILAVDKAGNETVKEQTFKGAKKPIIELLRDGQDLIMKISDEEGLQKIEYTLNGQLFSTDPDNTGEPINIKEVELRQKLVIGANSITIKAYNISGLVEEVTGEATI